MIQQINQSPIIANIETHIQHQISALSIIPIKVVLQAKQHTFHALIDTGSNITSIKQNLIPVLVLNLAYNIQAHG